MKVYLGQLTKGAAQCGAAQAAVIVYAPDLLRTAQRQHSLYRQAVQSLLLQRCCLTAAQTCVAFMYVPRYTMVVEFWQRNVKIIS